MSDCNNILSINASTGTTQGARPFPALQSNYFLLEERSIVDFIDYAQKMAQHLLFFNAQHTEDGNWEPFFNAEPVAILVYLSKSNLVFSERYATLKKEIDLVATETEKLDLANAFINNLNEPIRDVIHKLSGLPNDISAKEFFTGSSPMLESLMLDLQNQISSSTDISKTVLDFKFQKTGQAVDAIMAQWKTRSNDSISYLLEAYPKYSPHYALFLTFLKLMQHSINDLNTFTERHLNFYYQEVLKIQPKKAQPDSVHLIIEPNSDTPFELPANTIFPAGKNNAGIPKYYINASSQAFNNIQLQKLYSTNILKGKWYKNDLSELNAQGSAFGFFATQEEIVPTLYITHPILYMQGGSREIIIKFDGAAINHNLYHYYVTSEKEFIQLNEDFVTKDKITIPASEKGIIPYNAKIHKDLTLDTHLPVLVMKLKKGLTEFTFKKLQIKVHVKRCKHFLLSNDTGNIDAAKTFKPFGEFPTNNNTLVFTCNEFFVKPNAILSWRLFPSHRASVIFETLQEGSWTEVEDIEDNPFKKSRTYVYRNETPSTIIAPNETIAGTARDGYLRLKLSNDFYAGQNYLNTYIEKAKKESVTLPVPPTVETTSVDYICEANLFDWKTRKSSDQIYCYTATSFGYQPYHYPVMPNPGEIFLGFNKAEPNRSLSILFQLQEGSSNPFKEAALLQWSYLSANRWIQFNPNDLIDETKGLQQSGIVYASISTFNNNNTQHDASLFWIRIQVSDLEGICNVMGIHTQAIKAKLTAFDSNDGSFTEVTNPSTIKESFYIGNEIKKIKQPYVSFGGQALENITSMNVRASERLRHKQRAITSWDYERLVLENFPEVYKVKTLNHYQYDIHNLSSMAAGYVTLVVIMRSTIMENPVEWKPMPSLGLRQQIFDFLQRHHSGQVRLLVKPPIFEEIRVSAKVAFKLNPGDDSKIFQDRLIEALNRFISPWAYSDNSIEFVTAISHAKFIQLIDNLSYVDFVTELVLLHDGVQVNEVIPKTDYSLYKPHADHLIVELQTTCDK